MLSQHGCANSAVKGSLRLCEGDVGHIVKDHAFGCAGPCGALGKLIILLESNCINFFIYT